MVFSERELANKLQIIMHQWHIGTRPGNDGEAGNTLEDLLGIEENNLSLPDYGSIELKTQRYETSSLITLFHKEPKPKASVPKLLKSLGWKHQDAGTKYSISEMSFRSTTSGASYSDRGFKVVINNGRIEFIYTPTEVNRTIRDRTGIYDTYGDWADDVENRTAPNYGEIIPVYYDLGEIIFKLREKLENTLIVYCKTKLQNRRRYYRYKEAYLMKNIIYKNVESLIEDGKLIIDFDARTGHNHGTKFRIKKVDLGYLFEDFHFFD